MQVKKFEAPTIQEALDTIKRELGPEAIILQTKKHKRGFGLMSKDSVEVTAAVSERSLHKKQAVESRLPEPGKQVLSKMPSNRQADFIERYGQKTNEMRGSGAIAAGPPRAAPIPPRAPSVASASTVASAAPAPVTVPAKVTPTRYIDIDDPAPKASSTKLSVEEEVRYLKRMIEEMKDVQDSREFTGTAAQPIRAGGALEHPALQDAFDQLVINGLDKRYALTLVKAAAFELGEDGARNPDVLLDQIAAEIMNHTEIATPLPAKGAAPSIVALVGPTGVGKTTTIAKIASDALLRRGLKVGLINLDSYKVAAFDQLGTYAKILNVPFRSVANSEDLLAAVHDFRSLDLVLIDTTGRSQRDPDSLKEMQAVLQAIPEIRTQVVLAATTRDGELYDMANRFSVFRPQGIIVSKLDEATIYGSIYNVSQKAKLPLLYFTTGQRVPEDIEEATRERVASLVLEI
jgi:flagellar biosynthesis protein FlhF